MLMDNFYDNILNVPGGEELAGVLKRWKHLEENLRERGENHYNIVPDMLWINGRNAGSSQLLGMLSEYLEQNKLVYFNGDKKFFEFYLQYKSENEPFKELPRFMRALRNAAGFRSEFHGIAFIDITEWKKRYKSRLFASFLEFLADNTNEWLVILSVDGDGEEDVDPALIALLCSYLRLEIVRFSTPEPQALVEIIGRLISEYGLSLDKNAKALLAQSVEKLLTESTGFDVYKGVNLLARDIVYELYSAEECPGAVITKKQLEEFAPESEYISRMIQRQKQRNRRIGFISEEDV